MYVQNENASVSKLIIFIEKGKEWLFKNIYKHVDDKYLSMTFRHTNDAIEDFEKWMEESFPNRKIT